MSGWLAPVRGMRAAFAFLTRVPVGGFPYRPEELAWSAAHFPVVGIVLGAALAVLRALLAYGLGEGLAVSVLVVGASMMLTGALHEDGLADTADALGGSFDRDKIFAILKDSRVGTFGGAALAVSIVARTALYADLGAACTWALPLTACAARVGPVWLLAALPYATPEHAKSRSFAGAGVPQAVVATAWLALAGALSITHAGLAPARLGAMIGVLAVVTAATGLRYRARAGGVTGDFLGATEQLCEVAGLAVLAWSPR